MIELNCLQGSPEWHDARRGVVTASGADRIVTPKTLKPSASSSAYLSELLAGWALGYDEEGFLGSKWTERGHEYEGEARDAVALMCGVEVRSVGFCYKDEGRAIGCSPDGLMDSVTKEPNYGGVEIKCPMGKTHIGYLLNGGVPSDYRLQVQFSLWVTGRDYWIFSSYHPELPPLVVRVEPEPDVQSAFSEHVPAFVERLEMAKAELATMGVNDRENVSTGGS